MSEPFRKPLKEKIRTGDEEVLDLVFRSPTVRYGLQEIPKEFVKEIEVLEKKPGRIYIHCLKRKKEIFIYDKERGTGKLEEVIRQLWLRKLIKEYVTTLSDIPKVNQTWDDLFKIPKTYNQLSPDFDLSYIIERLEEMVLAQKQNSLYCS